MNNKEFKELLVLYKKLKDMFDEYERDFEIEENGAKPIFLPDSIYQEICKTIKQSEITLLGIS